MSLDSLNQTHRSLAEIGGVVSDLRLAESFEPRNAPVKSFDELVQIGQHLPCLRGAVYFDNFQCVLPSSDL